MILIIDNYDSFTYNLVQLLGRFRRDLMVKRNDEISLDELAAMKPERILISPGPGRPENAGVTVDVLKTFGSSIPILGVCLGHQAIGQAFGGKVVYAPTLMHGRTSRIQHDGKGLFTGIESPFVATRYHSLVVSPDGLPDCLTVTARTEDGVIMGLRHTHYPMEGVQFHPESVLTEEGEQMIGNWLAEGSKR